MISPSRYRFLRFGALALWAAAPWPLPAQAVNPLQGDLGVHDPVLIKAGGAYFAFATGSGVATKTSADRITWKNGPSAFATLPAWHKTLVPQAENSLWAPDISYRDGKYWLYYSVSSFGSNVSAIGLATTSALSASGRAAWIDQGVVIRSSAGDNYNAIDPNTVMDADGTLWLSFGSFWSGIKLVQLDAGTGMPIPDARILSLANHAAGIEAPFLCRQGAYWYLFVSWDRCCNGANSTYNIRVGRSAKITGPYLDSKGADMLAGGGDLIDDGDARWKGPGHSAILSDRDTVFLVNHAYDAQANGTSKLWIRPLYWTAGAWPTLDASAGKAVSVNARKPPGAALRKNRTWDLLGRPK
jgi:arabinan endo-1,5-alpha-L-arabinosidase